MKKCNASGQPRSPVEDRLGLRPNSPCPLHALPGMTVCEFHATPDAIRMHIHALANSLKNIRPGMQ